eukprot:gb/GECH01014036.1/.p1 GENE.gb/GECH01014036.1/~~gb/GECH01014036.1/.p1  ORF type:complete len:245 (+),score=42.58 gb/GECH01014036.1/:1-735(+)
MAPKYELISFTTCPFVQRSVITLLDKGVDFNIKFIDLKNKPDWFLKLSPLGKVPILRVNDNQILFESAVINEYLDEAEGTSSLSSDLFSKAQERAWIEFSTTPMMLLHKLFLAETQEDYNKHRDEFINKFQTMENYNPCPVQTPYFKGDQLSLVDAAYAPLFMRIKFLEKMAGEDLLAPTPTIKKWVDSCLAHPSVYNSAAKLMSESLGDNVPVAPEEIYKKYQELNISTLKRMAPNSIVFNQN